MPIQTGNGAKPKPSRLVQSRNDVLHNGIAAAQHPITVVDGTSYNSPFTASAKPLWNATNDNAQQVQLAPLKVESAGDVVPAMDFVKVHPWEKGTHFATTKNQHHIVKRAGGPDRKSDTPFHPDHPSVKSKPRPRLKPSSNEIAKATINNSFLRSGGTLGGHPDPQAGTSFNASRWAVTKKGVVA